jgi:hypothetical protein
MKQTLYTIAEDQRLINAMLEENGGELTPEIEEAMQITADNFIAKAEAYGATISEYDAQAEACAAEIKRLTAYQKTCENVSRRMKERIAQAMTAFDTNKVTAGTFRFSFRNSTAVVIENEDMIPDHFKDFVPQVRKKDIMEALKQGEFVAGATLETRQSLQMR